MSIPNITIRRRPLSIFDHLILVVVAALPMAAFHHAAGSGSRFAPQAIGLAAVMLAVGYFLWWLPRISARGGVLSALALPAFIAADGGLSLPGLRLLLRRPGRDRHGRRGAVDRAHLNHTTRRCSVNMHAVERISLTLVGWVSGAVTHQSTATVVGLCSANSTFYWDGLLGRRARPRLGSPAGLGFSLGLGGSAWRTAHWGWMPARE